MFQLHPYKFSSMNHWVSYKINGRFWLPYCQLGDYMLPTNKKREPGNSIDKMQEKAYPDTLRDPRMNSVDRVTSSTELMKDLHRYKGRHGGLYLRFKSSGS